MRTGEHWFRMLLLAVLWIGAQVSSGVAAPKPEAADARAHLQSAMDAVSALAGYHADVAVDITLRGWADRNLYWGKMPETS